jgi:hypothetical protein
MSRRDAAHGREGPDIRDPFDSLRSLRATLRVGFQLRKSANDNVERLPPRQRGRLTVCSFRSGGADNLIRERRADQAQGIGLWAADEVRCQKLEVRSKDPDRAKSIEQAQGNGRLAV